MHQPLIPSLRARVPSSGWGPLTVVLRGAHRLAPSRTHPLLLTLPDLIHLPAQSDRHPELRSAAALLAAESETPRPGTAAAVPALLDALLLYILRICFTERPAREDTRGWATRVGYTSEFAFAIAFERMHGTPPGMYRRSADPQRQT
ncbi:cupin domain-containing protein [Streptomyces sp. NPDC056491]|uniref:cupin domain-containing protein n=1 Tax=Streptomyces sp. NPDC056491 TaxID=3345837 RepID=UPI0036B46B23